MSEKVSKASLSDIKFDRANANKGSERGRGMIEASMREFGFADAGTLDRNNTIIGGNKRTEVAGEIELSDEAIIIDVDGTKPVFIRRNDLDLNDPNDDKARKLAYALNRSSEVSLNWDTEQLLADLNAGVDLSALFRDDELDALLAELTPKPEPPIDPGAQTDRAEELGAKWATAPGQIWQIAQHFVICGDCREPETWQRLLSAAGTVKVNGVFTSPPYAEQRKEQYGGIPADEYVDWWEAVQGNVRANLEDDGSFFVNIKNHSEDYVRTVYVHELAIAMTEQWGWTYLDEYCWERHGIPGDPRKMGKFKNQWEPVFWWSLTRHPKFRPEAVRHESDGAILDENFQSGLERSQGTGRNVVGNRKIGKGLAYPGNRIRAGNAEAIGHAAAFPVALPDFFIRAYSDPGDVWLDPFLGSGTTIVAAHQNERVGLGIEMLPKYMGVILERLQVATSQTPVRVG